jgi:hypothetical protein
MVAGFSAGSLYRSGSASRPAKAGPEDMDIVPFPSKLSPPADKIRAILTAKNGGAPLTCVAASGAGDID